MLVPKQNDLCELALLINQKYGDKDKSNMYIVFEVEEKTLNRVNEDFYYRNNPNAESENYVKADEINVIVDGVMFKYINKKED